MSEHERLLARYEAMRAEIGLRAVARDCATEDALAAQRAAHRKETRAWQMLSELREARRDSPGDLALVAAVGQAQAAWEAARDTAEAVNRQASTIARQALEDSEADSKLLYEMGLRVRAARPAAPDAPGDSTDPAPSAGKGARHRPPSLRRDP